jgi:ankyrin repeat protein
VRIGITSPSPFHAGLTQRWYALTSFFLAGNHEGLVNMTQLKGASDLKLEDYQRVEAMFKAAKEQAPPGSSVTSEVSKLSNFVLPKDMGSRVGCDRAIKQNSEGEKYMREGLPLHALCGSPGVTVELFDALLKAVLGISPKCMIAGDAAGRTCLHIACANTHCCDVELLARIAALHPEAAHIRADSADQLQSGLPLHILCSRTELTADMFHAVCSVHQEAAQTPSTAGLLPLQLLCTKNNVFTADLFQEVCKEHPGAAEKVDITGRTILHLVCEYHSRLPAGLLIAALEFCPQAASTTCAGGKTPLHSLCTNKALSAGSFKILEHAHPNAARVADHAGHYCFHLAAKHDQMPAEVFSAIHQSNPAAAQQEDSAGMLPLHYICSRHTGLASGVLKSMLEMSPGSAAHADGQHVLPLHLLCQNRAVTLDSFNLLLEAHPPAAECVSKKFQSILHFICNNSRVTLELAEAVLASAPKNASVTEEYGGFRHYPLHCLCMNKSCTPEIFELISQAHPDAVSSPGHFARYPLHLLCAKNESLTAQLYTRCFRAHPEAAWTRADNFKNAKSDVDESEAGSFPLHLLVKNNKKLDLKLFQAACESYPGAAGTRATAKSRYPLHLLCQHQLNLTVEIFETCRLAYPDVVLEKDKDGKCCVELICDKGFWDKVKEENSFLPTMQSDFTQSLLQQCADTDLFDRCCMLVEQCGADVDAGSMHDSRIPRKIGASSADARVRDYFSKVGAYMDKYQLDPSPEYECKCRKITTPLVSVF